MAFFSRWDFARDCTPSRPASPLHGGPWDIYGGIFMGLVGLASVQTRGKIVGGCGDVLYIWGIGIYVCVTIYVIWI
jgi:hypothetical protein